MNPETITRLKDEHLLEIREMHFARLENLYAGKQLDYVFVLNGILGHSKSNPYLEPIKWLEECLDSLLDYTEKAKDTDVFRPLVIEFGPYGVHFIDKILGANVYFHNDQWWADKLKTPIGTLEYPDISKNETWQLAKKVALAFVDIGVSVPLFGLPTLSSALNIAINLYGEEFLIAMLSDPDSAKHDLKVINDLICDLHRWYLRNIPIEQLQPVVAGWRCQPRGFGQLCGCSTHLISEDIYREFVAQLDDELLSVYPNGGMIHLCGIHTQHIPVWRKMKSLRAIQVNDRASEDLEIYFKELRYDQIIYFNPTNTMTIDIAINLTGGNRIVLVAEVNEKIRPKN